jgi:hypothetical protein
MKSQDTTQETGRPVEKMPTPNVEILDINDAKQQPQEPIVPHERKIVEGVIKLWKEDPDSESLGMAKLHALVKKRNPTWSLSEKRLKTVLKQYNLLSTSDQFTYANEITSKDTPNMEMPKNIRYQFTKNRGKGLYASNFFKQGELLWEEKSPLFFVPPLDHMKLINSANACTYCSTLLKTTSQLKKGLDCNICSDVWCSQQCKRSDKLHGLLKHNIYEEGKKSKKQIVSAAWKRYETYCFENKWNAAHAVALIHAHCITDKTGILEKQFDAFAKVRQDIRYKAIDSSGIGGSFDSSSGGALFIKEQQEALWVKGHEMFNAIFPLNQLTYGQYLEYLGCYNINNVDGSMFLIQAHLNHNCDPNIRVVFGDHKTDGIKAYAKRDIKANEELTTSYVNPAHDVQQRSRELRVNWGFKCNCQKCKDDLKALERRKSSGTADPSHKSAVKEMLEDVNNKEFELEIPQDNERSRRKSVRFEEKVIAVQE